MSVVTEVPLFLDLVSASATHTLCDVSVSVGEVKRICLCVGGVVEAVAAHAQTSGTGSQATAGRSARTGAHDVDSVAQVGDPGDRALVKLVT